MARGGSTQRLLPSDRNRIGKQIVLPWRKSLEICISSIRTRLGRSVVTLLGIVLAIAFLMSILTNRTIVDNLKAQNDERINLLLAQNVGVDVHDEKSLDHKRQQDLWLLTLSMLVALVGIVNSMLMSVTERFREIGTMKCLGALDAFIVRLFFIESAIQGLAGTLVGIPIGFLLTYLRTGATFGFGTFDYGPLLARSSVNVVVCMVLGTALAIVAAWWPARVAAHLQPVEAMRVEE
jgi:predicted lysophospholipase L1 biosynthesis ABC-type transport system permease subunit